MNNEKLGMVENGLNSLYGRSLDYSTAPMNVVQLTTALLAEDDPYWQASGAPKRSECLTAFGAEDAAHLARGAISTSHIQVRA